MGTCSYNNYSFIPIYNNKGNIKMTFENKLIEVLLRKVVEIRGNGLSTRILINGVKDSLHEHPEVLPEALAEALAFCKKKIVDAS